MRRFAIPAGTVLLLAAVARAESPSPMVDQAKAALALSAAKREREAAKAAAFAKSHCFANHGEAAYFASKTGRPLVLWVGMECKDSPAVREGLPDAVHCHLKEWAGDGSPRVVFGAKAGGDAYSYAKSELSAAVVPVIREKSGLPAK